MNQNFKEIDTPSPAIPSDINNSWDWEIDEF